MQNAFTADNKLTARAANQPVSLALAVRRSSSSRITGRGGGGRRWGKKKYIYINKSINRRVPLFFLWGGITWGGGTSSDFIHILRKWHGTRYKQQNNNDPRPVISFFFFSGEGEGGGKGNGKSGCYLLPVWRLMACPSPFYRQWGRGTRRRY